MSGAAARPWALVLGGEGAMGAAVAAELAELGYEVRVAGSAAPADRAGGGPAVSPVRGDARDQGFVDGLLDGRPDITIDFVDRPAEEFAGLVERLLAGSGRYVLVSSQLVYADAPRLTESTPRLLYASDDAALLKSGAPALEQARCEDVVAAAAHENWTIARLSLVYDGSAGRFPLGSLEAAGWLWRAQNGFPVPMPGAVLAARTTLTWGGDAGRVIARLAAAPEAAGDVFNVSCGEPITWERVAGIYAAASPLKLYRCELSDFCRVHGGAPTVRFDRALDRVVDGSKALAATGLGRAELTAPEEGLRRELAAYLAGAPAPVADVEEQAHLDRLAGTYSVGALMADGARFWDFIAWYFHRYF